MSTRIASKREVRFHRGRNRKDRPQTFSTEAKAKAWASRKGLKSFDIVKINTGLSRKVKVVAK